jgi:hypothetical protein
LQARRPLPKDVIERIVRANFGTFRTCYAAGLAKNPALEGKVSVTFIIARSGAVVAAQKTGPTLPDKEVVRCVGDAFTRLTFPAPENGTVVVEYAITFAPK